MKYFLLLPLFFISFLSHSQTANLLLNQNQITDWSAYPIYDRLVEESDGVVQWKAEYRYLDSIDVYGITYLSDGLKINGFLAKPKQPGNYPCIIVNRGGKREFGAWVVAGGAITLGQLAKEGYVVIASQYRGNGGSEGQEEFGGADVNDVVILTDVLKEIEGADASRIGMYGWSRGGMMTYIALTKTDKIKDGGGWRCLGRLFFKYSGSTGDGNGCHGGTDPGLLRQQGRRINQTIRDPLAGKVFKGSTHSDPPRKCRLARQTGTKSEPGNGAGKAQSAISPDHL